MPSRGHTSPKRVRPGPDRTSEPCRHAATGRPPSPLHPCTSYTCCRLQNGTHRTGRPAPTQIAPAGPRSGPRGAAATLRMPAELPCRAAPQHREPAAATPPPARAEPSPPEEHHRQKREAPPPPKPARGGTCHRRRRCTGRALQPLPTAATGREGLGDTGEEDPGARSAAAGGRRARARAAREERRRRRTAPGARKP